MAIVYGWNDALHQAESLGDKRVSDYLKGLQSQDKMPPEEISAPISGGVELIWHSEHRSVMFLPSGGICESSWKQAPRYPETM